MEDEREDPDSIIDEGPNEALGIEFLKEVRRGLADIEAGRVVPHDEARARLLKLIATDRPRSDAGRNAR